MRSYHFEMSATRYVLDTRCLVEFNRIYVNFTRLYHEC